MHVNLKYKFYTDQMLTNEVYQFIDKIKCEKQLVHKLSYEEKKGLFVLRLQLTVEYMFCKFEIIFRIFNHLTYPKNEEIINSYLAIYPHARPLYLISKEILHRAQLDDPGTYGINNFALFLMIIAFCQKFESFDRYRKSSNMSVSDTEVIKVEGVHSYPLPTFFDSSKPKLFPTSKDIPRPNVSQRANFAKLKEMNIGEILLNLIYFYGFSFDYTTTYICPYFYGDTHQESFFSVE